MTAVDRQLAIDQALASARLEGYDPASDPAIRELRQRFIDGEITANEAAELCPSHSES